MKNYINSILCLVSVLMVTACGGGADTASNINDNNQVNQDIPVDAGSDSSDIITPESNSQPDEPAVNITDDEITSSNIIETQNLSTGTVGMPQFAYYDIDSGAKLTLTDDEAKSNTQWDIAFKRTDIILNNHEDAKTTLFFTENTHDFYDEVSDEPILARFFNATPQSELSLFDNMNVDIQPANFVGDKIEPAIKNFYTYNPVTHTVTANPEMSFILRTGQTLIKFNITNIIQNGFGLDEYTFSIATQNNLETQFSTSENITVTKAACTAMRANISLITGETVTDDSWDISIPCQDGLLTLEINIAATAQAINDQAQTNVSGISVNSLPFSPWLDNNVTLAAYKEAGDQRSSLGWGEYNLNNNMLIWPNYATYIIKTDQAYHLFQVINYYHTQTQASGNYTVRHKKIKALLE